MPVMVEQVDVVPAETTTERGGTSQGGGVEETPEPSPHQIAQLVEMQQSRSERIRAY